MHYSPSPPQVVMDRFLYENDIAMLCVGMGIGKTASVLMRILRDLRSGYSIGALVVAPRRVASIVWADEAQEWDQLKPLKVAHLREDPDALKRGLHDVYVINFESMRLLVQQIRYLRKHRIPVPFDTVVVDEITHAKNPSSVRIRQLNKAVKPYALRKWGLTGTMMPTRLEDLFGQYRLLDDGQRLGRTLTAFRLAFLDQDPYCRWKRTPKEGATAAIAERISDITLTIESADYVDIPAPFVENVFIKMPDEISKMYRRLEKKLVLELASGAIIDAASMGVLVQKLLQFTSGRIIDENKEVHTIHKMKASAISEAIRTAKSPMLVARWFNHEKGMFKPTMHGRRVVMAESAKTPKQERELMKAWNAGDIDVLVANRRSLGHGLNLQHGGHEMLHTSLTHDRDAYDQFCGRMVRTGQKNHVRIRHLIVENTIDEAVLLNLEHKRSEEKALFACLKTLQAYRMNSLALL